MGEVDEADARWITAQQISKAFGVPLPIIGVTKESLEDARSLHELINQELMDGYHRHMAAIEHQLIYGDGTSDGPVGILGAAGWSPPTPAPETIDLSAILAEIQSARSSGA